MITAVVVDLDGVLRTWEKRPFAVLEAEHGLPAGSMAAVAFDPGRLLPAITGRVSDGQWRAGVAPHECALVDDARPSTDAAAALGMTTHLYRTPAALESFLAGLS